MCVCVHYFHEAFFKGTVLSRLVYAFARSMARWWRRQMRKRRQLRNIQRSGGYLYANLISGKKGKEPHSTLEKSGKGEGGGEYKEGGIKMGKNFGAAK